MGYTANDIRNICLLGHGGDGKSALCESMLFTTKAITRLGKRADGTTVSDFDDEEKKRQYSISTSVIPVEYNKCKINVLDNPGYFDFAGQIVQSLRVSDAGLICLTAKSGIGVGTEKGWKYLAKAGLPAMFYVSKLDEEHALIPENSHLFAAIGSALNAKEATVTTLSDLKERLSKPIHLEFEVARMEPLFRTEEDYDLFLQRQSRNQVKTAPLGTYKGN